MFSILYEDLQGFRLDEAWWGNLNNPCGSIWSCPVGVTVERWFIPSQPNPLVWILLCTVCCVCTVCTLSTVYTVRTYVCTVFHCMWCTYTVCTVLLALCVCTVYIVCAVCTVCTIGMYCVYCISTLHTIGMYVHCELLLCAYVRM